MSHFRISRLSFPAFDCVDRPTLRDKGAGARMNKAAAMLDDRHFTHRLPLALLLALLNCVPARARNVECPAVWPGDSSKSKVKDAAVYINDQTEPPWEESQHGTRFEVVVYGEFIDLQCLYAKRRILFTPLPARTPCECRSAAAESQAREQCSKIQHEYCCAAYSSRFRPWR